MPRRDPFMCPHMDIGASEDPCGKCGLIVQEVEYICRDGMSFDKDYFSALQQEEVRLRGNVDHNQIRARWQSWCIRAHVHEGTHGGGLEHQVCLWRAACRMFRVYRLAFRATAASKGRTHILFVREITADRRDEAPVTARVVAVDDERAAFPLSRGLTVAESACRPQTMKTARAQQDQEATEVHRRRGGRGGARASIVVYRSSGVGEVAPWRTGDVIVRTVEKLHLRAWKRRRAWWRAARGVACLFGIAIALFVLVSTIQLLNLRHRVGPTATAADVAKVEASLGNLPSSLLIYGRVQSLFHCSWPTTPGILKREVKLHQLRDMITRRQYKDLQDTMRDLVRGSVESEGIFVEEVKQGIVGPVIGDLSARLRTAKTDSDMQGLIEDCTVATELFPDAEWGRVLLQLARKLQELAADTEGGLGDDVITLAGRMQTIRKHYIAPIAERGPDSLSARDAKTLRGACDHVEKTQTKQIQRLAEMLLTRTGDTSSADLPAHETAVRAVRSGTDACTQIAGLESVACSLHAREVMLKALRYLYRGQPEKAVEQLEGLTDEFMEARDREEVATLLGLSSQAARDMIFVAGGILVLGSERGSRDTAFSPVRKVELQPFYIAKTEVADDRIREFLRFQNRPAAAEAALTLEDARELVTSMKLNLPTEDEWEAGVAWDPDGASLMKYPAGVRFDSAGRCVQGEDALNCCTNVIGGHWEFVEGQYEGNAILKGCSARVAQLCWLTDPEICQTTYRFTVSKRAASDDFGVRPVLRIPETVVALYERGSRQRE